MITKQAVEEQLKRIGCNFRFWGRSEVNELGRIMMEDEIIAECVNGQYTNGFALLVATNHRVLLVDKKPLLYLTVEDLRFDMITEFNYNHRLMDATIRIFTTNKTLVFTSWNQHRLRKLLEYIQAHVLEMRQQNHMAQQFQAAAAAQFAQMHMAQQYGNLGQQNQAPPIPEPNFAPNLANPVTQPPLPASTEAVAAQPANQSPAQAQEQPRAQEQPQTVHDDIASRFATRRAALGTYTRSKLPAIRRHMPGSGPVPESGEVFQQGYPLKPTLKNLGMPLEYEG
jgi:hypothetical protein